MGLKRILKELLFNFFCTPNIWEFAPWKGETGPCILVLVPLRLAKPGPMESS